MKAYIIRYCQILMSILTELFCIILVARDNKDCGCFIWSCTGSCHLPHIRIVSKAASCLFLIVKTWQADQCSEWHQPRDVQSYPTHYIRWSYFLDFRFQCIAFNNTRKLHWCQISTTCILVQICLHFALSTAQGVHANKRPQKCTRR